MLNRVSSSRMTCSRASVNVPLLSHPQNRPLQAKSHHPKPTPAHSPRGTPLCKGLLVVVAGVDEPRLKREPTCRWGTWDLDEGGGQYDHPQTPRAPRGP